MKYIAPEAKLVLLDTELIMSSLSSDDQLPDDDDMDALAAQADWE